MKKRFLSLLLALVMVLCLLPTTALAASFDVTVTDGSGGGTYDEGATVTITADEPTTGQRFKEWTGVDGLTFTEGSATTATASFIMPANPVALTAKY